MTRLALTFDVDWAAEFVLRDVFALLAEARARCTVFATHESASLRAQEEVEVGLHPNFNPLLSGAGGDHRVIVDELLALYPQAQGLRSHSLVQAPQILEHCAQRGLSYDCNLFLPQRVAAFYDFSGMIRLSYAWADNAHCLGGEPFELATLPLEEDTDEGLVVLAFHPVHVYLDTESPERYVAARPHLNDELALSAQRNTSARPGARRLLLEVLAWSRREGVELTLLSEAADAARARLGASPVRPAGDMKRSGLPQDDA